jgi:DNA polymerase bacteriophage-type
MMKKLWLDFETRSYCDLKDCGLDVYAKHPTTEVLMLAWAFDDDEVKLWLPILGEPIPEELQAGLADPDTMLMAWNYNFEKSIFAHKLGMVLTQKRWVDPSVLCAYMALPIGLDRAANACNIDITLKKQGVGKVGINTFSEPSKRKKTELKKNPDLSPTFFKDWNTDPEKWAEFCEYCFTPEHTLLGEDLLWKAASDFKVGDVVLGFDEDGPNRKYRRAKIEVLSYEDAPVFEVLLESGKIFRVTKEHQWLTTRSKKSHGNQSLRWVETQNLAVRDHGRSRIPRLIQPWVPETSFDAGWLAGIFDGEGTYGKNHLSISQNPGIVQDRIRKGLASYVKISASVTKKNSICQTIHIKGHKMETLRLLGQLRPNRLLSKVNFDKLGQMECRDLRDGVVSIIPVGTKRIIKIQTSTRTLVVDGYPMHNCRQDVRAERAVWYAAVDFNCPMPQSEIQAWLLDQRMNDAGVWIDRPFVENAKHYAEVEASGIVEEMKTVTGCENPNSPKQLKDWMAAQGCSMPSMDKAHVAEWLKESFKLSAAVVKLLELKQKLGGSAYKKLESILLRVGPDGRLRNQFMYHGAHTGRWSGRGVQLQNLFKAIKTVSTVLDPVTISIRNGNLDIHKIVTEFNVNIDEWNFLNPDKEQKKHLKMFTMMEAVAGTIRSSFAATPGNKLSVGDLAQIESRVLAGLAGCQTMIDAYASGLDLYKDIMSFLLEKPYDQITSAERANGKVIILGCGFGMGWEKFIDYAATFGVTLDEKTAKRYVNAFRDKYTEIPSFWKELNAACVKAVKLNICVYVRGLVVDGRNPQMLKIKLPSGRYLHYLRPVATEETTDWGATREGVSYESWDEKGLNMKRLYGGLICENVVQAVARDLLLAGMLEAEQAGGTVIMTVHDEVVVESPLDSSFNCEVLLKGMTLVPEWAEGLGFVLAAEGYDCAYYRKG